MPFAELARLAGVPAPALEERVYSITWEHNGEVWTATVGEQMTGRGTISKGRGPKRVEREVPLSNASTVLAIFPGQPFFVWHDGASARWANPFMAGVPLSVRRFSPAI